MLVRTLLAMKSATFSGTSTRSASAFLRRIATLVSMSGGWMSAIRPHSKRLCRRSSIVGIWRGGQSGADHDLLLRVVEGVEDVEELLLRPILAGDELDVVDQEHVDQAVLLAKGLEAIEADRVDHLVDEAVGRDVEDVQPLLARQDVVADRVHEVGLAEPDAAVDEERVVGLRGDLGDGAGGGMRELVRGADDEALEGVLGVEVGGVPVGRRGRLRAQGCLILRPLLEDHMSLTPPDLGQGLLEHAQVVLAQPLSKLRVRYGDAQRVAVLREKARGPKPRGEAVSVDLAFDTRQDFIPQVFGHRALVSPGPREGSSERNRFRSISYEQNASAPLQPIGRVLLHRVFNSCGKEGAGGIRGTAVSGVRNP